MKGGMPALPKWKVAACIVTWLAGLGVTASLVVGGLLRRQRPLYTDHGLVWCSITAVMLLVGLVCGVLALRGRRVSARLSIGAALVPLAVSAGLALARFSGVPGRGYEGVLQRDEIDALLLLHHGGSATAVLLFAVGVASGTALLRARSAGGPDGEASRMRLALLIAGGVGLLPGLLLIRSTIGGARLHPHDLHVLFLPASVINASILLGVVRRFEGEAPSTANLRQARDAFVVALWAPAGFALASVVGAYVAFDSAFVGAFAEIVANVVATRARGIGAVLHLVSAAMLFGVAVTALRPPKTVRVGALALPVVVLAVGIACLVRFDRALARHVSRGPTAIVLGAPLPPPLAEPEKPRTIGYTPFRLPLAPPGIAPMSPPDADRAMAAAREPPPPVPELAKPLPALLERLQRECEGSEPKSCAALAEIVISESLTFAPLVLASALYDRGCKRGDDRACGRFGLHLLRSWGVLEDSERGLSLLEASCKKGSWDACGHLGTHLSWGRYVAPQWERGQTLLRDACAHHVWHACAILARTGRGGSDEHERHSALARTAAEAGCRRGEVESCLQLDFRTPGNIPGGVERFDLASGSWLRGGSVTCNKALPLSCELDAMLRDQRAACRQGFATGCRQTLDPDYLAACRAGLLSACGDWIAQAKEGSKERARRAAEACRYGHRAACAIGVDPRTPEGVRAFEALCPSVVLDLNEENHDPKACEVAGQAYQRGKVVPRNVGRALELYRRGCWDSPRHPSHAACQALAQMFMSGDGVPADPQRAYALFASHCGVDGRSSCRALADFLERVAPADETEAAREHRERLRKKGK